MRIGVAGILVVALAQLAPCAFAAGDVRRFDVAFTAPEGCPARESFIEQVLARTQRALASGEAAEYRFTLTITDTEQGIQGDLGIRGADGVDSSRDVPGPDCSSVVEAAALIAALVLDPHAATGPLPASSIAALPPAPPGEPPAQRKVEPISAPPAPETPAPILDGSRAEQRSSWRLGVAAAGAISGGVAPRPAPGVAFGLRLFHAANRVWSPMFGTDGEFTATSVQSELGSASFTSLTGRLWGCPLGWGTTSVALRPCGMLHAGMVRAAGDATVRPRTQTVPWMAAGVFGRLEWMATRSAGFELQAGAVLPFFRDRYVFLPDDVVHTVPVLAASASAGATVWLN